MHYSYLFYDIETSGLNKCFDQVLQFAAIHTDLELMELKRYKIYIRLNPDTVPAPEAFITHQISLQTIQELGVSEFEGISKIHALLNAPGTKSVGYNNLGFDDEFLRFSFYRNLLSPYTHQYVHGCSRFDLYPITVLYFLFKNNLLSWPERENLSTLKLELLGAANNLINGVAHDAMNDAEAALGLARRFIKERKMWDYALLYFDKNTDLKRIAELPEAFEISGISYQEGILLDGVFGAENFYHCPILTLGWHNHYKNQLLLLRLDEEKLCETTLENIAGNTSIYRKKAGESGLLLPFSPRFSRYLSNDRRKRVWENKLWLQRNPQILAAISNYHREYQYPKISNLDIDATLYQRGFPSDFEVFWCQRFHKLDLQGKLAQLEDMASADLRARALRLLGRNFLNFLPKHLLKEFNLYLKGVFSSEDSKITVDYRGERRLTPQKALKQIEELSIKGGLSDCQIKLLEEIKDYIFGLLQKAD